MIPANNTNESNSMRLKNTRNGPTKTMAIAPAHKSLPGALLIDSENKTITLHLRVSAEQQVLDHSAPHAPVIFLPRRAGEE